MTTVTKFAVCIALYVVGFYAFSARSQLTAFSEETFKDEEAVLFTFFDTITRRAHIKYSQGAGRDLGGTALNFSTLALSRTTRAEFYGMTASYKTKEIFFHEVGAEELMVYNVLTGKIERVAKFLTSGLKGIVFDFVTKVLYWTDSEEKSIIALEENYRHIARIYQSIDIEPMAITIHHIKRKLFFSKLSLGAGDLTMARIMKCDLDGGNVETIVRFPDTIAALSITVDIDDDKLYWSDMSLIGQAVIMASDLNGGLRRQFYAASTGVIVGLEYFSKTFYATNAGSRSDPFARTKIHIRYKDEYGGRELITNMKPRGVAGYGPTKATKEIIANECVLDTCDHICLASAGGRFSCKCSPGYKLTGRNKCETEMLEDNYLIFSDLGQKRLFQMKLAEKSIVVTEFSAVPLNDAYEIPIVAMAVDPSDGSVAYYDGRDKKILWGREAVSFTLGAIAGMEIHPCEKRIFFHTLDGIFSWAPGDDSYKSLYRLNFFSSSSVFHLALDLARGHIYWTEYNELDKLGKVLRCNLNGSNVETVLQSAQYMKPITVDHETYSLNVFSTEGLKLYNLPLKILEDVPSDDPESYHYKQYDLSEKVSNRSAISDIAVVNGMVYFVDTEYASIRRFSLVTGASSLENYGPPGFFYAITISFYSAEYYEKNILPLPSCRKYLPTEEPTTVATTRATTAAAKPAPGGGGSKANVCDVVLNRISAKGDISAAVKVYLSCIFRGIGGTNGISQLAGLGL